MADFPLVSAATVSVPARPVRPGLTLGLLSLQHALIHGQSALYPIVFLAISAEFGIGAESIAVLAAVGAICTGTIQLTFGALTRRFTKRSLLGVGGMAFGIGTAAQAAVSSFVAFVPVNVASRLGGAPQHPVGNALLTEQYASNRWGTAISAHIAGGNIGTVVFGVIATGAVAIYGWRTSVLWLGVAAAVVGLCVYLFIREAHAHPAASAHERPTVRDAYRQVIGDRDLRWLFLSSVLGGGARGLGVLNVFVPLYLTFVLHLDTATVALMYTVLVIASVPGPLVAGWLSDILGRKPLIIGAYIGGAISLAVFVLAGDNPVLLWLSIVALSLFNFVESPQLQALLSDLTPPGLRDAAFFATVLRGVAFDFTAFFTAFFFVAMMSSGSINTDA